MVSQTGSFSKSAYRLETVPQGLVIRVTGFEIGVGKPSRSAGKRAVDVCVGWIETLMAIGAE